VSNHRPTLAFVLAVLALSSAGMRAQTVVVVEEGLGKVVEVDESNHACRAEIPVGLKPHEIAFSTDGRIAYVTNFGLLEANFKVGVPGKTISVIDIARGVEVKQLVIPEGPLAGPHGIKFRPGTATGAELFTNAEIGDTMLIFDPAAGKVRRTFPLPSGVHNFIFSRDGASFYAFSTKGQVFKIESDSGHIDATANVASPRGLAWTPDNANLIVAGKGEVQLLDPKTLSAIKVFTGLDVGQLFYPTASPDGRLIFAPAVLDGVVLVIDAITGKVLQRVPAGSPLSVTLQPDHNTTWISNVHVPQQMQKPGSQPLPGGVSALDLATLRTTPLPDVTDANGLAVSPIKLSACESQALPIFHANDIILFQGDSITDGGRQRTGSDYNHIMGQDYAYILAAQLGAEYPDRNLTFLNRGVSGERIIDLAARWQSDVLDLQPNVLSILVGINDTLANGDRAETVEQFEATYDSLLAKTIAALPSIKIVLGEPFILPVGKHEKDYAAQLAEVKKRQAVVAKLASKYHLSLIHYQAIFDEACRKAPADHWSWDGIHPTYAGHGLMAQEWLKTANAFWPNA
jgi:DNA-binding beta-propeller fold protein YncE